MEKHSIWNNSLDGIYSIPGKSEEMVNELKCKSIEITQNEAQRGK